METTIEKTPYEITQEMIQKDSSVIKIRERMRVLAENKDFSWEYHMWETALSDWTTGVNTAIEKNNQEIARKLLRVGVSAEVIQETTGLDMETIQSLE
jgi:hypothetical protein